MSDGVRDPALSAHDLHVHYGSVYALRGVTINVPRHRVTAFIGPSACGKSTLLRCFNRMNDGIDGFRVSGDVRVEGLDVYRPDVSLEALRTRVGMVFQKSNPFPMSIRDNITFGPRMRGVRSRADLDRALQTALQLADLWREVRDRLDASALELSGGQQQRLCIARALANEPHILLLDEPASSLDPMSTAKIEETLVHLRDRLTVVMVTHNLQQAARVSDYTGVLMEGELIEFDTSTTMFTNPSHQLAEDYITGRFG
jgi:phosphate transport system ATP-binding protein